MVAAPKRSRSGRMDERSMRLLTDTHTLVWALAQPEILGKAARTGLAELELTASVANLWELVLRAHRPGALVANPLPWWDRYVHQRIPTLSIRTSHIRRLATLPEIHKDPFDRILVAQALEEGLTLASKDALLTRYDVPVIWS